MLPALGAPGAGPGVGAGAGPPPGGGAGVCAAVARLLSTSAAVSGGVAGSLTTCVLPSENSSTGLAARDAAGASTASAARTAAAIHVLPASTADNANPLGPRRLQHRRRERGAPRC